MGWVSKKASGNRNRWRKTRRRTSATSLSPSQDSKYIRRATAAAYSTMTVNNRKNADCREAWRFVVARVSMKYPSTFGNESKLPEETRSAARANARRRGCSRRKLPMICSVAIPSFFVLFGLSIHIVTEMARRTKKKARRFVRRAFDKSGRWMDQRDSPFSSALDPECCLNQPMITGRTDRTTTAMITREKFFFTIGRLPKK